MLIQPFIQLTYDPIYLLLTDWIGYIFYQTFKSFPSLIPPPLFREDEHLDGSGVRRWNHLPTLRRPLNIHALVSDCFNNYGQMIEIKTLLKKKKLSPSLLWL